MKKISINKYNKIINKILKNPKIEVHEKLIKALEKAGGYEIEDFKKEE